MNQHPIEHLTHEEIELLKNKADSFFVKATTHPELLSATSRQYFSKCNEENNPPDVIEDGHVKVEYGIFVDYNRILLDRFEFPFKADVSVAEYGLNIRRVLDSYLVGLFRAFGWPQVPLTPEGVAMPKERPVDPTAEEQLAVNVSAFLEAHIVVGQVITDELKKELVDGLKVIVENYRAVKDSQQPKS